MSDAACGVIPGEPEQRLSGEDAMHEEPFQPIRFTPPFPCRLFVLEYTDDGLPLDEYELALVPFAEQAADFVPVGVPLGCEWISCSGLGEFAVVNRGPSWIIEVELPVWITPVMWRLHTHCDPLHQNQLS